MPTAHTDPGVAPSSAGVRATVLFDQGLRVELEADGPLLWDARNCGYGLEDISCQHGTRRPRHGP